MPARSLLTSLLLTALQQPAAALSTPCRWQLRASVGRTKGMTTSMPEAWGKSGNCLPITVDVDVFGTPAGENDERVGAGASKLEPLRSEISITGFGGAVEKPVRGGGWQIEDGKLRMWLDFPEGACCSADGDTCNVWDLAPGVALQGIDVELPGGRLYFETDVWDDADLEEQNKRYIGARSAAWRAKGEVNAIEKAKTPEKLWSAEKNAWVTEVVKEGFVSEQRKRAALAKAERVQDEIDQQRPKREILSREAGQWPSDSPARWLGRKGTLLVKRSGIFGSLPFGIGHHYTCVGTWSAEPEEPVETFWTMPD